MENIYNITVYNITQIINGCVKIAEYYYKETFDRSSAEFERFFVHLRCLAQRLFQNKPLPRAFYDDDVFVAMIKKTCKVHYKCALCLKDYIEKAYKNSINSDELVTLTVHLKKINKKADIQ